MHRCSSEQTSLDLVPLENLDVVCFFVKIVDTSQSFFVEPINRKELE